MPTRTSSTHGPCRRSSPFSVPFSLDIGELEKCAKELVADEIAVCLSRTKARPRHVEEIVVNGPATAMRLDHARGADLLVVGSRGVGGFAGLLLESVSQQCVHHAFCPVAVIHDRREAGPIVVGVDGSWAADSALDWALGEAARVGTGVEVVAARPEAHADGHGAACDHDVRAMSAGEIDRARLLGARSG